MTARACVPDPPSPLATARVASPAAFGLLTAAIAALAGCPPPPRYMVADVFAHGAPLPDAMVAANCPSSSRQPGRGPAERTDESGRARLRFSADTPIEQCSLRVAKPGYPTIDAPTGSACMTPSHCPPIAIALDGAPVIPLPQAPVAAPARGHAHPAEVAR